MLESKELKQCRHPKEKWIFYLAALPVILGFLAFLIWWAVSPETLKNIVAENVVTEDSVAGLINDTPDENEQANGSKIGEQNSQVDSLFQTLSEEEKQEVQSLRNSVLVPLVASPFTPLAILAFFLLLTIVMVGKTYGNSLGNGVELSKKQFPQVYEMFEQMAQEIGLRKTPTIILVNGNGVLNAFACTVPMIRDNVIIYSDIFERCIANDDMKTLKFILGHELGHIKFYHTKWWYRFLTLPLELTPGVNKIFGSGLSRAREYSCDKLGAKLSGDNDGRSLMILSSGKHNYHDVDLEEYMHKHNRKSIWVTFANFFMDHPINSWRIISIAKKHLGGIWFRKK